MKTAIFSWGPVETLKNGYFVRVYSLSHLFSKLSKTVTLFQYIEEEDGKPYYQPFPSSIAKNIYDVFLPGNKTSLGIYKKYIRFTIYQIVNFIKIRSFLSRHDIVIFASQLFLPTLILLKIVPKKKKVLIAVDPQMFLYEREERKRRKSLAFVLRAFEKLVLNLSDFNVAISPRMAEVLRNIAPARPAFVIPHMLPPTMARRVKCKRRRSDQTIVAFIGDLFAEHNFHSVLFLLSVARMLDKMVKGRVRLVVVGRVPDDRALAIRRKVAQGLSHVDVEVVGFVEDLDRYICDNVDILVAPVFTMSGVSTKMMYYLRFLDKYIVASREALEGLEHLVVGRRNVVIADGPMDFFLKLLGVIYEISR